jgi:hypothetical protein
MWDRWLPVARDVAEVVIALAAVLTLILVFHDSRTTHDALDAAAEAFRAQTSPLVRFSDYHVLGAMGNECEPPIVGLRLFVRNRSAVSVSLSAAHVKVFLGSKPIPIEPGEIERRRTGETILGPGEEGSIATFGNKDFAEAYARWPKSWAEPLMRLQISVPVRPVALPNRRYKYDSEIVLLQHCEPGLNNGWAANSETFGEVASVETPPAPQ